MASNVKGIIYGTQSKIVRRFVIPDPGENVNFALHVGPGESVLLVPITDDTSLEAANAAVERATGVRPANPRCVIVNPQGDVLDTIAADPLIDVHPNGQLFQHDRAGPGWKRKPNGDFDPPGRPENPGSQGNKP